MRSLLFAAITGTLCRFLTCDAPVHTPWPKGEPDTSWKVPEVNAEALQHLEAAAADMLAEGRPSRAQSMNIATGRSSWAAPMTATRGMALLRQTLSRARHTTQPPLEVPPLRTASARGPHEDTRARPIFSLWNVDDSGRLQLAQLSWLDDGIDQSQDGPRMQAQSDPAGNGKCSCSSVGGSIVSVRGVAEAASQAIGAVQEARTALVFMSAIIAAAWAWTRGSACGLRCFALLVLLVTMQTRGLRDGFGGREAAAAPVEQA